MRTSFRNAMRAAACACLAFTTACTTMTQGTSQELFLQAQDEAKNPVTAIPCKVYTKENQWNLIAPGKITVDRSERQLFIVCESEQWVMAQTTKIDADTSFVKTFGTNMGIGAGVGALLFLLWPPAIFVAGPISITLGASAGAVVGAEVGVVTSGVDMATGAFWEYAPEITVTVKPRSAPVPAAASATPLPAARSASAAANAPSQ